MRVHDLWSRAKGRTPEDRAFETEVAAARAAALQLAGPLRAKMGPLGWDQIRLADLPLGQDWEKASPDTQVAAGLVAQEELARQHWTFDASGARSVTVAYARKRLPWTAAQVAVLLDVARESKSRWLSDVYRLPFGAAERLTPDQLTCLKDRLQQTERHLEQSEDSPTDRNKLIRRVHALLSGPDALDRGTADGEQDAGRSRVLQAVLSPALLNDGDEWRATLPAAVQAAVGAGPVAAVLAHAGTCDNVRPTRSWQ